MRAPWRVASSVNVCGLRSDCIHAAPLDSPEDPLLRLALAVSFPLAVGSLANT